MVSEINNELTGFIILIRGSVFMFRFNLPGKMRTKKIILIILVIVAICIIVTNGIDNRKGKNDNINTEEESIIQPMDEVSNEDKVSENYIDEEKKLYDRAYDLFFSKKYDESIKCAENLIESYPDSYMGYNIMGIAKVYNGQFDSGMQDIDKALSINNEYGYGRFNKALAYELYGDMDDALMWYHEALKVENYVWSYYGIASIYGRRGDVDNTVKYLSEAIKLDERVKESAKGEEDFKPVSKDKKFIELLNN